MRAVGPFSGASITTCSNPLAMALELSMLEYFPTNYVWNLSTNIALLMGGNIGEVDTICRQLLDASQAGDDSGTVSFFKTWCEQADRLVELAEEDETAGCKLSASAKYGRAATYYITAERMQNRHFEPRRHAYRLMLECFGKYIALGGLNCERVEIPYRGTHLAALFERAHRPDGRPAPCIAFFNGLDSTKEMIFGSDIGRELARRGISTLMVDQPGAGEALRLQDLQAIVESEQWAEALSKISPALLARSSPPGLISMSTEIATITMV